MDSLLDYVRANTRTAVIAAVCLVVVLIIFILWICDCMPRWRRKKVITNPDKETDIDNLIDAIHDAQKPRN